MPLGWYKKKAVEKSVKKVIARIIHSVDQTIEKNPGLTMEEALKIVDKKQGVFFPAEPSDSGDLKSLFTIIVWKSYRSAHLQDPGASSPERREFVTVLVQRYLNGGAPNDKARSKVFVRPLPLAAGATAVIVILAIGLFLHSKIPITFSHMGKETHALPSPEIAYSSSPAATESISPPVREADKSAPSHEDLFKYHGYASDDRRKMALVNKSVYLEGDLLDEEERYVLKSIHPKHIVIKDINDKSEFSVALQ